MLTWLLHLLKTLLKRPVGSKQTGSFNAARSEEVAQPPELTNADLELLFNELLEGVHQERGQQWALKYLQRMEDRISDERWIDWLLGFGEKLLISPAPNHQLATRMVQLGELNIGTVGELAYDIGIRLLTKDLDESVEYSQDLEATETTTSTVIDSPGQELIRNLGELLWESDDLVTEIQLTATPTIIVEESLPEEVGELIWEYVGEKDKSLEVPLLMPAKEDVIGNLSELVFDYTRQTTNITRSTSPLAKAAIIAEENWDQSLTNLEPNVAHTLDELLVRLDQSANLVQQLASNLATQTNQIQAINIEPGNVLIQAQVLFYQGLQQAKTGNLLGAIASYNQALELNPNSWEYWFNKGLTLFHLENFTEAIASYDQAIYFKPDYYKAWYNRGGTLGELGQFDEANACFERAIAIQPDNPEAWASKGLVYLKLGQIAEAISSYDQALLLEPQDQENWYYRGIGLAVDEQYEEAIQSYDEALEIQPDFHEVWIDRGVVLFNLKRWSEAIASWDKALSTQPDFYLAWYNRGLALDNLVRREEAIASYRQAIAIKPDFHLAWYNQAVALFYLERYTEAIISYDNALEIKLDYWEAWIGRGTAVGYLVNADTPLNLLTTITATNPALKQAGYQGKLASYEAGLTYIRPDTHPEGWGRLHLAIANTYYDGGKKYPTSRNYWHQALAEYNQALLTLTREDFPQLHLEVLQSLIKALLGLGDTAQAQKLQEYGTNLLQQLLSEPTRSDDSKKQLALKFAGLGQLAVDVAVEYGDLVEAWEMAEYGKDSCLTWLLFGWNADIQLPKYRSVQHLLNPTTAIVYWHISPVALHTFIIKDQAPSPILIFTPIQDYNKLPNDLPLPEAVRRLIKFEDWLEDWNQAYQQYRDQAQDSQSKSNHSWRMEMEQRLLQLQEILEISTIQQELEGITQLILVPHRDLHRLPLHTLFHLSSPYLIELPTVESNFTISYLPSIQTGLSARTENIIWQLANQTLLSIEYPHSTDNSTIKFANLESEIVSQMFNNPHRIQGSEATKNNVKNSLFDNYNIFHFAGHATNNLSEPKKSELVLTGEDKITLEEICQQTLASYKLVTLSACETTSISNQMITTEYLSLVNSFLSAGVPYVVSTLWNVESSASALLIIEFYRRLQPDKSASTALAQATAWLKELTAVELTKWYENLLNELHPDELKLRAYLATHIYRTSKMTPDKKLYCHPYYWAAFTITGNTQEGD